MIGDDLTDFFHLLYSITVCDVSFVLALGIIDGLRGLGGYPLSFACYFRWIE